MRIRKLNNIIVTGGAGFIGSNFIRFLFEKTDFKGRIINIDLLTYAGNLKNLEDIEQKISKNRYVFKKTDICNFDDVEDIFKSFDIDTVVHFAAESHVDRSIVGPKAFIITNIIGTFTLLEVCMKYWADRKDVLFHHVSTDEVFGSLGKEGYFIESTPYDPKSPYSASKASSDHLVRAINHTYNLPVTISNCSNNYGPYQFPEKLIPLMILNILEEKPLPVYGDGSNVRDWLYVEDHASAIWKILNDGKTGETYNIGGDSEYKNIEIVNMLCDKISDKNNKNKDHYKKLITYVKDRLGHDKRYAIDCRKIKTELGWRREMDFDKGLNFTIDWYINNMEWVNGIKSGEYREWIDKYYKERVIT